MDRVWRVHHKGQLGNRMFQYMIATVIAKRVPGLSICGLNIPEWGITDDSEQLRNLKRDFDKTLRLEGHRFNIRAVVAALQNNSVDCVEYDGWACRVEYYGGPELLRGLFPTSDDLRDVGFPDNTLLINVRAAEIVRGVHRDYAPTPISLIEHVIEKTGLTPLFMGQLGDDWYSRSLQDRFRGHEFIPSRGPMHDFETIRQTKNVLIPVSTFSWLACWLSETCTNIHMPLLGMFNPMQRPDIDLVPLQDERYTFYGFPRVHWRGKREQLDSLRFTEAGKISILRRQYLGRLLDKIRLSSR